MNPQNPNQPQGPQIYGPQQYSPMPVPPGSLPGQPPKKSNKKLFIAVIVLAVLLVVVIVVAVLMNVIKDSSSGGQEISRKYDSPAGLVPGMQSEDIRSGKFKMTASYLTGGDFTREGTFVVEDGRIYFDIVKDEARVNELMKYLYARKRSVAPFDAENHGVNRGQTYDFAAMLGYHYLYDTNGGQLSGFIPAVEAAKSATKPGKQFTLTSACDTALDEVKKQTDISTTGVVFEISQEGVNKSRAVISFASRQSIDKAVISFFDSCYDLNSPESAKLKGFVDGIRQEIKPSPTFTYWQEGGVNYLDVSAPPKDTPFGGEMHFELSDLSKTTVQREGSAGTYVERRNQFGLAYSLCRVDPVVTTTQAAGYRFLREDPSYSYPSAADSGYYCTTLSIPTQFKPVTSIVLKTTTGANSAISGEALDGLRGHHDLVFEVEKYNLGNERYPGPIELRDIANSNMGALTSVTQRIYADKSLVYTPSPAGCVGTCNDFVLSFVPAPNAQIRRTTYRP